MPMLSWRLRALYDDEFGKRIDRWFGFVVAGVLLCIGLQPVIFGAGPHEPPIGVFTTLMAVYFLFAAMFKPGLVSPFSLPLIALIGTVFRLKPGVDRAIDVDQIDRERNQHKTIDTDLVD